MLRGRRGRRDSPALVAWLLIPYFMRNAWFAGFLVFVDEALFMPRIKRVAQPIAEQIEREYQQEN